MLRRNHSIWQRSRMTIVSEDPVRWPGRAARQRVLSRLLSVHSDPPPAAQTATVLDVRDRIADVGLVRADLLSWMAEKGQVDPSEFKVLAPQSIDGYPWPTSTELYPEWALASLPWVDSGLAEAVGRVRRPGERGGSATPSMHD